jgi:hypothetical protein
MYWSLIVFLFGLWCLPQAQGTNISLVDSIFAHLRIQYSILFRISVQGLMIVFLPDMDTALIHHQNYTEMIIVYDFMT